MKLTSITTLFVLLSCILYVRAEEDEYICGVDTFFKPLKNIGRRRRYSIANNKYSCQNCPNGQYMDKLNHKSESCIQCPAGTSKTIRTTIDKSGKLHNLYCNGIPCKKGYYGINNSCYECPNGKYSNAIGSYKCDTCPMGKYSYVKYLECKNSIKCKNGEGIYLLKDNWSNCTKCKVGQFQNINNTYTKCKSCTKKMGYQNQTGQSTCIKFNSCKRGSMQFYKDNVIFTNKTDSYCKSCLDIKIQYSYLVIALIMTCLLIYILLLFIFIKINKIELTPHGYICNIICLSGTLTILYRIFYISGIVYTVLSIYYLNCIQLNIFIYTYNIIIVYDFIYFYLLIKYNLENNNPENNNLEKKHLLFRK